jgi:hypothetical protein
MSEMCHFRTHAPQQITSLFNHFRGGCEQRSRDAETERLRDFGVDDELEFQRVWTGSSLGFSPFRT